MEHDSLNIIGTVILAAIACQYIAWRLKIPSIILLTLSGLVLGPLTHTIDPTSILGDELHLLAELIVVILLFEGSLYLKLHELKEISSNVTRLIVFGVLVNGFLTTCAAHYIANFSWEISLIIGLILVVTGPTVIIPILRQTPLPKKIKSYLKWEGIINDPIGVFLVTLAFQYDTTAHGSFPLVNEFLTILKALLFVLFITFVVGYLLKYLFEKTYYPDFLKVPTVLSTILLVFIASKEVQNGSGLLAVTGLGMFLTNSNLVVISELRKFKESIGVFLVSLVFILLAANIDINSIKALNLHHFIFIAAVVLFIRVISIFIATISSDMSFKEKLLLGWFGPRGIVAASMAGIFSLRLIEAGNDEAKLILPIIFSVICLTVFIHSLSLKPLAEALGLTLDSGKGLIIIGASNWTTNLALVLRSINIPILLIDSNWKKLQKARQAGIKTHYGEAIAELEEGKLDLSEYRYLLAATNADAYNTLVCNIFSEDFGKLNVFQIALDANASLLDELPKSQGGQIIQNENFVFDNLNIKSYQGWEFQKTTLSDEFDYQEFTNQNPSSEPEVFLVINTKNHLSFTLDQKNLSAKSGDTLVYFSEQ